MTKTVLICISILLVILAAFYGPKLTRLYKLANLYNEDKIASNFINIDKIFQVSEPIPSSNNPHSFPRRDFDLPATYYFEGQERNLEEGLSHFKTDGLMVCTTVICYMKIIGMVIAQQANI